MRASIILAGALCAGCSLMPDWFNREPPVEVSEVARSSQCATPGADAQVTRLADAAAVQAWQQARGIELAPLPRGPFALVEMGERPTGGYGFAISRIAGRRGDALVLHATFVAPRADDMTTQALTQPCVLVSIPDGYSEILLLDQDGRQRARSGGGR